MLSSVSADVSISFGARVRCHCHLQNRCTKAHGVGPPFTDRFRKSNKSLLKTGFRFSEGFCSFICRTCAKVGKGCCHQIGQENCYVKERLLALRTACSMVGLALNS